MAIQFYNTLTRKKEAFKPIKAKEVKMYNCGPTVYDFAHIGNFRAFVCSDILKRYLLYKGFKVKQVMNITDVDDKTINGAKKEGTTLRKFTSKYEKAFFDDLESLNILKAEVFPKATEHIKEMVALIKKLLEKEVAYKSEDGSIYFAIGKFKDYGKFAHIDFDKLQSTERVKNDDYGKENATDFVLWKAYDREDGDVFWNTELCKGRPGWHIECSAMSMKYLGETFDVHTGGIDLIFPHHQNEIAQSEAATGKKFVNYWLHNDYILVDGKKMSKRLGNFYTLRDLLKKGYNARAIRYLLLSSNYRQQLNFTLEGVTAASHSVERLNEFMTKVSLAMEKGEKGEASSEVEKLANDVTSQFEKEMDNDLEISNALAAIFEFIKEINKIYLNKEDAKSVHDIMMKFDTVLGVLSAEEELEAEFKKLVAEREEARKKKDFKTADKIRYELKEKGIILEDTPDGVIWKKVN